jgi:hypothetical protein
MKLTQEKFPEVSQQQCGDLSFVIKEGRMPSFSFSEKYIQNYCQET